MTRPDFPRFAFPRPVPPTQGVLSERIGDDSTNVVVELMSLFEGLGESSRSCVPSRAFVDTGGWAVRGDDDATSISGARGWVAVSVVEFVTKGAKSGIFS